MLKIDLIRCVLIRGLEPSSLVSFSVSLSSTNSLLLASDSLSLPLTRQYHVKC